MEDGLIRECSFKTNDFSGKTAVFFGCENQNDLWRVIHDSDEVAQRAIRELLGLGLENYGFVGFRIATPWSRSRERFFLRETAAQGVQTTVFDPCKCSKTASPPQFYDSLKEWLEAIPKPCGIFAANDEMGAHVLRVATPWSSARLSSSASMPAEPERHGRHPRHGGRTQKRRGSIQGHHWTLD